MKGNQLTNGFTMSLIVLAFNQFLAKTTKVLIVKYNVYCTNRQIRFKTLQH